MKSESVRTIFVGVVGTTLSFTLERYSLFASAAAATFTAAFMALKCLDWIIEKRLKNHQDECPAAQKELPPKPPDPTV